MFLIIVSENELVEKLDFEPARNTPTENVICMACSMGNFPTGAHKCAICQVYPFKLTARKSRGNERILRTTIVHYRLPFIFSKAVVYR